MSTLQRQVMQFLNGLSDDNLRFLSDMIQRFMKPAESSEENSFVELSFMLGMLADGSTMSGLFYKGNITPPSDYSQ